MLLVGLAVAVVLGSALLASLHLRAVRRTLGRTPKELATELQRLPVDERLAALRSRAPRGTFEAKLGEALSGVTDAQAKAVATNELLRDLEFELESRARWSPVAVRLVLFGEFLIAAVALIELALAEACAVFVLGGVGAGLAVALGNRARKLDLAQRQSADRFVELVLPNAIHAPSMRGRLKRPR